MGVSLCFHKVTIPQNNSWMVLDTLTHPPSNILWLRQLGHMAVTASTLHSDTISERYRNPMSSQTWKNTAGASNKFLVIAPVGLTGCVRVCDKVHRHQACFGSQGGSSHCKCNMLFGLDVKASRQEQQLQQAAVASHFTAAPRTNQHIADPGLSHRLFLLFYSTATERR